MATQNHPIGAELARQQKRMAEMFAAELVARADMMTAGQLRAAVAYLAGLGRIERAAVSDALDHAALCAPESDR